MQTPRTPASEHHNENIEVQLGVTVFARSHDFENARLSNRDFTIIARLGNRDLNAFARLGYYCH